MSEFGGGLVGAALKDIVAGKDNFNQLKLMLDNYLKVLSEGRYESIINYMIRITNDTKKLCSHCGYSGNGDSWEQCGSNFLQT